MKDFHETALNYLVEDEYMTFCTCEKKWINRINKLKEEHPDDVDITDYPESNHGYHGGSSSKKLVHHSRAAQGGIERRRKTTTF